MTTQIMIDQIGAEGNAVIGDLEMEITKMDEEIRAQEKALQRADRFKAQYEQLRDLWRDHLDDSYPQDDDEQEATARQILWNDSDSKNLAEYEKSDAGYIPF